MTHAPFILKSETKEVFTMKKTTKVITVALVVIALGAAVVSAAPGFGPGFGPMAAGAPGQAVTLTDAQKQELVPIYNQMFELRKQMIQKYVGFGTLTQEQADWRIGAMKERHENMLKNGGPGAGFGPGGCRGGGPGGRGPGYGPRSQQNPPQ
jgi:hypothetical protein